MNQEGFPNLFYNIFVELDDQIKYLAFASDFLEGLDKAPNERDLLLEKIGKETNTFNEFYLPFLKNITDYCDIKEMPFLQSYFQNLSLILLTHWINHPEKKKWEAALPILWQKSFQKNFVDAFGQEASLLRLIQSLSSPEKFQVAIESLMKFKYEMGPGLPKTLISYESPTLSIQKKMEIVKNAFWDKKIRKNVLGPIVSCQKDFFDTIRLRLTDPQKSQNCLELIGTPSHLTQLDSGPIYQIIKNLNIKNWIALSLVSKGHYQRFLNAFKEILPSCINEILNQNSTISFSFLFFKGSVKYQEFCGAFNF